MGSSVILLCLGCSVLSEMIKGGSKGRLGQLEMTPVSKAIARHMCVDLSPKHQTTCNRRGIAIIIYGAPQTGKIVAFQFRK